MGIVRDLYYARKMSAGLKLPAPTVALLIKRLRLAAAMGGGVTKTVSGAPAHITDALAKAALSVLVNITPIQPGSGDPSPSNVRPISGLTGLSVYRRGANLLNTATNITGKYIASGGGISNGDDAQYTDLIPVKAGETYVCSFVSGRNSGNNRWHGYDSNGGWVKQLAYVSATDQQGAKLAMVATIDSGISYVRLSYGITDTEAMVKKQNYDRLINTFYLAAIPNGVPQIEDSSSPIQSPHNGKWKVGVYFEAIPGDEYVFSHDVFANGTYVSGNYLHVGFYEKAEDVTDASKCLSHLNGVKQFTVPNEAHYVVIEFEGAKPFTFSFVALVKVDNDYQPYTYNEYPCDWSTQAGTVYGGTLDVVTGVLAITHKGFVFDGTENLTAAGNGGITAVYKFATNADKIVYTDSPQTKKSDYKCSHYKWSGYMYSPSFSDVRVGTGANAASNERFTFMNALIGRTLTQFKQYLTDQYNAGTPVTVYAPLATPITYQLTPQEVQMLLGENYVWSSSGDTVSVTYYAEGNANTLQSLNILLGGNYSNPKTADDVSDKEALEIILGGNK